MGVAFLIHECFKRTKMLRTDLQAMYEFDEARSGDSIPDGIKLFWDMWQPQYDLLDGSPSSIGYRDNAPALDDDLEDVVLEKLALLERECRISHVPDAGLWGNYYGELSESVIRYIHLGAASALRHRKRDRLTEDVVDTLQEVSNKFHLFNMPNHLARTLADILDTPHDPARPFAPYLADAPHDIVSRFGVRALVHREIAYVKSVDGKYQEAFDMAFDSFVSAEAVQDAVVAYSDREFLLEMFGEEGLALEEETRDAIRRCLPLQDPQQVVDCFEELKRQDKSDNWRLVARQCARLAGTIDDDLSESSVLDGNHQEIDWYGYWRRAQGWAEEHLGPQELRELRKAYEEEASEDRLKRYFFGDLWEKIPEKAREHLVNVDSTWFDKSRGRGFGVVLNDLQVAAEVMCHFFIWEPLLKFPGDLQSWARDGELQNKGLFPTLSDYARACREDGFKEFVQEQGVSTEDQRFLRQRLPKALNRLRRNRDDAQHNPERRMHREEVGEFVRSFLGIGEPGVLRSLVEVGQKLVSK